MPTPEQDLAAILGGSDLGQVDAVFTIATGPTVTVTTKGWFTDATQQTNILTGEVETVNPTFTAQTTGIAGVKRSHTVVINTVTYTIERLERLGTGVTLVHLTT